MTVRRLLVGFVAIATVALVLVKTRTAILFRQPTDQLPAPATAEYFVSKGTTLGSGSSSDDKSEPASLVVPLREKLSGQPAVTPPEFSELLVTDRPPLADRLGASATPPGQEPRIVLDVLDAYRRSFGSYPAGEDNRQIVNALLGANAQKLPFFPADHSRLSESGEVFDAWGTPFFFHLISRDVIEVRSAGPDGSFYSDDDIVAGTPRPKSTQSVIPDYPPVP